MAKSALMARRLFNRRRVLIDHRQLRLLGITLGYFLAITAIFSFAVLIPQVWRLYVDDPALAQVVADSPTLQPGFWAALALIFVALSAHSIITTHRIVGPLYRFRIIFDQVEHGNLVPWIGLRRGDFLVREAEALDGMISSLRDRVDSLTATHREALTQSAGLEQALQTGSVREARVHLVELERTLTDQRQQLEAFYIEAD